MIVRTRGGHQTEVRTTGPFQLTDMVAWGYQGLRNVRTPVGEREARGIPALTRAARLRAEAVAQLPLCCWRGEGTMRERVEGVWQAELFSNGPQATATNPVQSRFTFWETVEESLAWRNNAFIWCNVQPSTGRITTWYALHPDQVRPKFDRGGTVVYEVVVQAGYIDPVGNGPGKYERDEQTILHIRGHGYGGQLLAPSPVEVYRDKLAGPIGRQRHEARMWRRGAAAQLGVMFPAGVSREQADQWREVYRGNYEGTEGETTIVLGGGAEIKPIGMTPADTQFVEMAHLTIEDAALIMGMPTDLIGVQLQRTPEDKEQIRRQWLQDGLGPELSRIEEALYAYPPLFGGSRTKPGFDTSNFVRGDLATEATIIQGDVQAGILTPNEARHLKGYAPDPDPNSDTLQITPVGGAENPNVKGAQTPAPPSEPVAEAKNWTVPSLELRVDQNMEPVARELGASLDRITLVLAEQARITSELARTVAQEQGRRTELEERHGRELRDAHQETREIRQLWDEQEPPEPPTIVVNVPETPVTVENTINVPETPVTVNLDVDNAPMTVEFKRNPRTGMVESAVITEDE